jgi:DNA-binding response OmpR family regulator
MSGGRIILAEDDPELRSFVSSALRRTQYQVVEVKDGVELAEQLNLAQLRREKVRPFDVVISDVRMPGRTGLDVLAALRFHHWGTPVILLTAFGDRELHETAMRLGAVAVLDKPFDIDDLRKLVRNLIKDEEAAPRAVDRHQ